MEPSQETPPPSTSKGGRPRRTRKAASAAEQSPGLACSHCNVAFSPKDLNYPASKKTKNSAIQHNGSWYHNKCYDALRYKRRREAAKIYTISLPLYGSEPEHCIFTNCDQTNLQLIPKKLLYKCALHKLLIIERGSKACLHHLNLLESLQFEPDQLLKIDDTAKVTPSENSQLIAGMSGSARTESSHRTSFSFAELPDDQFRRRVGMSREQFDRLKEQLNFSMDFSNITNPDFTLGIYFWKMKTGLPDAAIGTVCGLTQQAVNYHINRARNILNLQFAPSFLGFSRMNPDTIWQHTTRTAMGLFFPGQKKLILVLDSTYVYIQKSFNFPFQRRSFSTHKSRNLFKMMMITTTDGLIVDALGPYPANTSDSTLMEDFLSDEPVADMLEPSKTVFIVDRGFRDIIPKLRQRGYTVYMPAFLDKKKKQKQFTWQQANHTRIVTKVRWIVEAVNGQIKQHFRYFDRTIFNRALPNAPIDFRICCALLNYLKNGGWACDTDHPEVILRINQQMFRPNRLAELVAKLNLTQRRTHFRQLDDEPTHSGFPQFDLNQLQILFCGTYQLKLAASYYAEHINPHGWYEFSVEAESNPIDYTRAGITIPSSSLKLYKARMDSRHRNSIMYQIFILVNSADGVEGIDQIEETFCTCPVGTRTIGVCAHVACVIWYLSYACHHPDEITLPAQSFSTFFKDIELLPNVREPSGTGSQSQSRREDQLEELIQSEVDLFVENEDDQVEDLNQNENNTEDDDDDDDDYGLDIGQDDDQEGDQAVNQGNDLIGHQIGDHQVEPMEVENQAGDNSDSSMSDLLDYT